jgi:excisionase family DNA binding protein
MESNILKELHEIKQLTLLSSKTVLTMDDLSILTGLSKSHIYKLVSWKKIPHYKSNGGKLTFFEKSEVEKWLLQNRVRTSDEIEAEAQLYCMKKGKGNRS